jgi:serine/threonine-protein kinase
MWGRTVKSTRTIELGLLRDGNVPRLTHIGRRPAFQIPMTQLLPGMVVTPTIRLVSQLGRGGMGSVWVAEHLALRTQVVVKFMSAELALHSEAVERFSREAAAAAQVRSPHVVQMLDHGVTPAGVPFIVMEMLEGHDLARHLEMHGRLSLPQTAEIVAQVCKALGRAHERGIVHRDIKPDNIFLCEVGGGETFVKLLDFGIAKGGNVPLGGSSGTRTGAMIGTPFYMSPEQIVGAKSIDHRTDLWSLGVVAYQCVVGAKPFQADTFGALAIAIHSGPVPAPSAVDAALPPGFDAWFARACARDPAARFGGAKELADALFAVTGATTGGAARSVPGAAPTPGVPTLPVYAGSAPAPLFPTAPIGTGAPLGPSPTNSGIGLGTGNRPRPGGGFAGWIVAGVGALVVLGASGVWLVARKSTAAAAPIAASIVAPPPPAAAPPPAPEETLAPLPAPVASETAAPAAMDAAAPSVRPTAAAPTPTARAAAPPAHAPAAGPHARPPQGPTPPSGEKDIF